MSFNCSYPKRLWSLFKLWRCQIIWCLYCLIILLVTSSSTCLAQQIIPDNKTNTTLSTNGNTTDVSTQTIKNNNAFNSFKRLNVNKGNTVNLNVPSQAKNLVNVVHDEKTNIEGTLNSIKNGQVGGNVYLVNPNGITVGPEGSINVGSLNAVTPTKDYTNKFFDTNGAPNAAAVDALMNGNVPINPDAEINNQGKINAIETVILESGTINNTGQITTGYIPKSELDTEDLVNTDNTEKDPQVIVKNHGIYIETTKSFYNSGTIATKNSSSTKQNIYVNSQGSIGLDNGSLVSTLGEKGNIILEGKFVSIGGTVKTDGQTGGNVKIKSGTLSLAGAISAKGSSNNGGNVNITVQNQTFESGSSIIDVSGASGGNISHISEQQITTSGTYKAIGTDGNGGNIDITAPALKFLSPKIDVSGYINGGTIQLGGEYQGGKNLTNDIIPNAKVLTMTEGTNIKADSTGFNGDGGTIITWADQQAVVLGDFTALPGINLGEGGFVEVSSGGNLTFRGNVQTGINNRTGEFLLDPKNIIIADTNYNQYSIIVGYNYDTIIDDLSYTPFLTTGDNFGFSVSVDNNTLAIGVPGNDGDDNTNNNSGAVYLYTFTDSNFGNAVFEGVIGDNYTGGKNIDQSLEAFDKFGSSVSLNSSRLAVGAIGDDDSINSIFDSGAVYLYTFTDSTFSGGNLEAIIGDGYSVGKSFNQTLGISDYFGMSVSLDGDRLAVGSPSDDGPALDSGDNYGSIYLYSFTDSSFSGCVLEAIIGEGYSGGKNYDQTLDAGDMFGLAVSLDGLRLAAGAPNDDGALDASTNTGAVYLYTFTDTSFNGVSHVSTIGDSYTGGSNYNLTLDDDYLGSSVSLDSTLLAIGAIGDDGAINDYSDSGAVYLFSFSDMIFTDPTLELTIGTNYSSVNDINQSLNDNDNFGSAVSLDNYRLVVGAPYDDGYSNDNTDSGAVYFYLFEDLNFNGSILKGVVGDGYTSSKDLNQDIELIDHFGGSVSLNNNQLVVGSFYDDGYDNLLEDSGAVYLYTFTDNYFAGGVLEAIIGSGYTGGKNINQTLDTNDMFGRSVSLDNYRLVIGASGDDGSSDSVSSSGAVYLYTFTDTLFNGGNLEGIIGDGYTTGKNIDLSYLGNSDYFGSSVSLYGNILAVGATGDDNALNTGDANGAVYLFTFSDKTFSGGAVVGAIGSGYTLGNSINQTLDDGDYFGVSVSLENNNLAIGAMLDDGSGNTYIDTGAVYLYSFEDNCFTGGTLEGIIGQNYTGGKNINVSSLYNGDLFGISVSLDNNRIAIGSIGDDGYGKDIYIEEEILMEFFYAPGAVYLYSFEDSTFNGGDLEAIIGNGYTGSKNIDQDLTILSGFGGAVSLEGRQLVVGAPWHAGEHTQMNIEEDLPARGAVYFYTFDDYAFNNGTYEGIISYNENNIIDQPFDMLDNFGMSVDLDSHRLVVGASGDDGYNTNNGFNFEELSFYGKGAVYLYTFTDNHYSNCTLEGIIGDGYTGGKNVDQTLGDWDTFGASVSLDGDRLAVGAPLDFGLTDTTLGAGAVYLYTFTDSEFSGGNLEATIGLGYSGAKNIDQTLDEMDFFGRSVSLNGNRLVVGAHYDNNATDTGDNTGAVYLYSFSDASFSGGLLEGIIGSGYTGGKNINVTLGNDDFFGAAVSLDGNSLAIGVPGDDDATNTTSAAGAVYLYTFTDSVFTGGDLEGIIGSGYTGGKNINITLDASDNFGTGVSLNNNRLAIGSPGDDGDSNSGDDNGAIYLYSFTDSYFSGGTLESTIGYAYTAAKDINTSFSLATIGQAVALDNNNLAISNLSGEMEMFFFGFGGGVYLYSFTDSSFNGGSLDYVITDSYSFDDFAGQISNSNPYYATSISLDSDRIAVGVPFNGDDVMFEGPESAKGAVYLYTFTGSGFSESVLESIIGDGYTGGKNIDQALDEESCFGISVSLDGNRLAVGSDYDAGFDNSGDEIGAVYLYTFTDSEFSGGNLESIIGSGYSVAKDMDISNLADEDGFGISVSLNGNRLVVGANGDDGNADSAEDTGAVYLFSFTDSSFSGGTLEGIIGSGYTGGKNYNLALDDDDMIGSAVSLDNNSLVFEAPGDDGFGDGSQNAGAVYMFSFADSVFTTPVHQGTIGDGYTGGKDIDLNLSSDNIRESSFGNRISLDNNRLALGMPGDDGFDDSGWLEGAVYLYSFTDSVFSGANLEAIIGNGYTGGKNINQPLGNLSSFGTSVSLDGNNLAVSAYESQDNDSLFMFEFMGIGSGVVYLYNFTDSAFNGGEVGGLLDNGLIQSQINKTTLDSDDAFGTSVSIDGNRLVVGIPGDDSYGNIGSNAGSVHLYSFGDSNFSNGILEGIIGDNYLGGKNIDISLDSDDAFGSAVSINSNSLAIGAPYDDGADNTRSDTGAVYLFSFIDSYFSDGKLEAIIGDDYTGGKNININLNNIDYFGSSVSLDADRLAVGAEGDDGFTNSVGSAGAVYLYSFTDSVFSGGNLEAIIGTGYAGLKDFDQTLDTGDYFGGSVSLDGNRLAVGAYRDYGYDNLADGSGTVYLYTFTDNTFSGCNLEGNIGSGYIGAKDIDENIDNWDYFGKSVSLDGNLLAVGAYFDDGSADNYTNTGSVYVYSFTDSSFLGGQLEAIIGTGYTGGKNIDLQLDDSDYLGISVSLDENHIAIGASGDDGFNNSGSNNGAVYIYSHLFASDTGYTISDIDEFAEYYDQTVTITTYDLEQLLATPQNVTLQASNDITILDNIEVINASGDGGNLTLQAGRNIYIYNDIISDNGNIVLTANETLANGVIDAQRDSGHAVIFISGNTLLDAGSGDISIEITNGLGKTFTESGDITISDLLATNISVYNNGATAGSDIIINNNGMLSASGNSNPLVLSTTNGNFYNYSGSNALSSISDRWLVYSSDPASTTEGSLTYNKIYNTTFFTDPPATIPAGDYILYSIAPELTITAENKLRTYGTANPAFTYTISGLIDGDIEANAVTGIPSITCAAIATSTVGGYTIDIEQGTLALTSLGYQFNSFPDGTLMITPATLDVTADNKSRTYGAANPALTYTITGYQNGEDYGTSDLIGTPNITTISAPTDGVGVQVGIIDSAVGTLASTNYAFNYVDGNMTITPATITVTPDDVNREYGEITPVYSVSYTGFKNAETIGTIAGYAGSPTLNGPADTSLWNVNTYADQIDLTGTTETATNYTFVIDNGDPGDITVNQAVLTVTPDDVSREYGENTPVYSVSYTGFKNAETIGTIAGYAGSPTLNGPADTSLWNVNTYADQIDLTGTTETATNYTFVIDNGDPGDITVTQAVLTVTPDDVSREYGENTPVYSVSYTGFKNAETIGTIAGYAGSPTLNGPADTSLWNVNTYADQIDLTGTTETATNYTFVIDNGDPGDITVTQAVLTVTPDDVNREYGEITPVYSVSYTGFKNAETIGTIAGYAGSPTLNGPLIHHCGTSIHTPIKSI